MANLIRISQVNFYVGFSANIAECFACKKVLEDNQINYSLFNGVNAAQQEVVLADLSTYVFTTNFSQYTFTDFPIITWLESYDDYERCLNVSTSAADLTNSNLVLHKDLIV